MSTREGWPNPLQLPGRRHFQETMSVPERGLTRPDIPGLYVLTRRLGTLWARSVTGTRVHVPLDNEACDDKGGPSATQSRRPNAQSGEVPDAPSGTSLSTGLKSAPRPVSPWSRGVDATFCKHFFVFYLARILVQNISIGPWKAVSKGQPAGLRAKWGTKSRRVGCSPGGPQVPLEASPWPERHT